MHFFPVLWLFFKLTISGAETRVNRFWLRPDTAELEVYLKADVVHLFCFEWPSLYDWFSNCLHDFNVSLRVSNEVWGHWNPTLKPLNVYGELMYREAPPELTCSTLESLSSESSPFDLLSLLLPTSVGSVKKTPLSIEGLNWTSPSYSPSCIAVCSVESKIIGNLPKLIVQVNPILNPKRLLSTFVGTLLLFAANFFSSSITFYYFSGSSLVVLGSLLVVLIMFIRVLPFRRGGAILQTAVVLLGGTFSLMLVALDYARSSVLQFLTDNIELTFIYTILVTILSMVFFYWLHLPERLVVNYPRTKIIMKYFLKILGASMIVSSVSLPFTDDELLLKSLDYIPSSVHSTLTSSPTLLQTLKRLSLKFFWILLVFTFVLCVSIVEAVYSCMLNPPSCPQKGFNYAQIKGNPVDLDKLPGSPWASSSPYHYPIATPVDVPRRFSVIEPHAARMSFSHGHTPGHDSAYCNGNDVFNKSPAIYARKMNEDILTDDESE